MFDFGIRLKELRELHHLTQDQLGRKIGRSKSVISSYENNIKVPPVDILVELAVIYNVSLDYLVGIDKAEMISVASLTDNQKEIIKLLVYELSDVSKVGVGLSQRQQDIIGKLMLEFSKKS